MKNKIFSIIIFSLVFILAAFVGLRAYASLTDSQITACVKKDGSLHIVSTGTSCIKGENLLTWNIVGPKGDKGDTGEQGPQGQPGSTRHAFDANNQDLGELISINDSNNYVVTFLPDKGYLTLKPIYQGFEITSNYNAPEILYTELNCTGDSFMVNGSPLPQTIIRISGSPTTYWAFKPGTRMNRSPFSRRYTATNTCANDTYGTLDTFLFEQITLPFSEPIAWPLHIQ